MKSVIFFRCLPFSGLHPLTTGLASCLLWLASPAITHGAELTASDGATFSLLGISVGESGTIGLVGAAGATIGSNSSQGAAYVFRSLDTASGTVTQNVKLTASDGAAGDRFGQSVSQSGTIGLVGAYQAKIGSNSLQGAAYVYRNLDTASGTVTQDVKLTASDGAASNFFGYSVSQSGTIGLVGAYLATIGSNGQQGAAYVYRNLDTATGTLGVLTQNVKLTASDGAAGNFFGYSVSQSGTIGLVGAYGATVSGHSQQGAAYVFRNLDTANGTGGVLTQDVKLTASDGAASDLFGSFVSLSGTIGLVGAYEAKVGSNSQQGAAYLFRNLDTATGTLGVLTQDVKLTASDGAASTFFGYSVSQSGSIGLVGAYGSTIGSNSNQGAAYVFRNLDTASGTVTQDVKLFASDGAASNLFGRYVSLSGDQFTIGAYGANSGTGKAYTGTVSSVTTLDAGSTSRTISGISFVSQDDWITGQNTSGNAVTLLSGNSANVTAAGKAVYVGQNAGSNNNTLTIGGTLTANQVNVGAVGNTGNSLVVNGTVTAPIAIASGSALSGNGTVSGTVMVGGGATVMPWIGSASNLKTQNIFWTSSTSVFKPVVDFSGAQTADELSVTGTVNIASSILDLTGALNLPGNLSGSETFLLVNNDGSDAINGTFGTVNAPAGYSASVNYAYTGTDFLGRVGDGNDLAVTYTLASAPEPSRILLLLCGLAAMAMRRRNMR